MSDTGRSKTAPRVPRERTLRDCSASFTREQIQNIATERVSTGLPELDRILNGGLANGLYVLGAVPGLGKSTLALQIAYNVSGQGVPVLYFALEMSRNWITAKALCRADFMGSGQGSFQASDLLDARASRHFSDETWERIDRAREQIQREGAHLYLYEQGPDLNHIEHIEACIGAFRSAHQEYGQDFPLMVVVDYLQILAPREAALRSSDKQIIDDIVRELCRIRDQQQVIILLISALNRVSYNRPITLESFKESGSIEYSADVILGMQYHGIDRKGFSLEEAKNRRPRELDLTLLKMRYGRDGLSIPLRFYSESSYFQQPEGSGQSQRTRCQELREQFLSSCPLIHYHDGLHREAREIER